ncbi:cache domain-containing protein [Anaeromyxobacter terrae]|uniref:cache domain-containing protein n=1 Tax=Anaeromyxobacter terrae TaxID=2925406 RepID=UPI001F59C424|nr:cache domain-containing protein [Anaeromyxobacter sp. SG22]
MKKLLAAALAAVVLGAFGQAAAAEPYATSKDAELLVHRAALFMKKEGKEKAIATFNDPHGPFIYRDLYVFAYDLDGTCLAHPTKPERVGKNNMSDKDPDGREFVRERLQLARKHGKGWQQYKFNNPVTNKVEQKVAYFELVDGVVLVAGAYKK